MIQASLDFAQKDYMRVPLITFITVMFLQTEHLRLSDYRNYCSFLIHTIDGKHDNDGGRRLVSVSQNLFLETVVD